MSKLLIKPITFFRKILYSCRRLHHKLLKFISLEAHYCIYDQSLKTIYTVLEFCITASQTSILIYPHTDYDDGHLASPYWLRMLQSLLYEQAAFLATKLTHLHSAPHLLTAHLHQELNAKTSNSAGIPITYLTDVTSSVAQFPLLF